MREDRRPSVQEEPSLGAQRNNNNHAGNRVLVGSMLAWEFVRAVASSFLKIFSKAPSPTATNAPATAAEISGRPTDRNLHPGRDHASHQQWGMVLVLSAFFAGVIAGLGFLFLYWTGGSNVLLGGTLALCLGGFGVSLVLYSHWLMAAREATEPREPHSSNESQREAVAEDFYAEPDFYRRSVLKSIGVGAIGMMAAIIISFIRSLGRPPGPSLFTTVWKRGQSLTTVDGTPVTVNALQPGNFMIVFPKDSIGDEKAQTVLVRVNEKALQLPADRADWAPMGYVAYSRVCTHAGCSVGMFESTTDQLMCPCHQSTFDVLRAAQPSGGPAARPLPQLPLYADADGTLRAGGGFSEPPGPGFWEMP